MARPKKTTKGKKGKKTSRSIKEKTNGLKPLKIPMKTKKAITDHITEIVWGKDELVSNLTERQTRKIVDATVTALAETITRSIMPKGFGEFHLSKTFKVYLAKKKAVKKGTMVRNPATGEMMPSKGKPASMKVKIKPLSHLKKAAEGEL